MIIDVLDVNDEFPKWVFPAIPGQSQVAPWGTRNMYIAAISRDAKPRASILTPSVQRIDVIGTVFVSVP